MFLGLGREEKEKGKIRLLWCRLDSRPECIDLSRVSIRRSRGRGEVKEDRIRDSKRRRKRMRRCRVRSRVERRGVREVRRRRMSMIRRLERRTSREESTPRYAR